MSLLSGLALFSLGTATHLLYFKRGEHHLYALTYIKVSCLAFVLAAYLKTHYANQSLSTSFITTSLHSAFFLSGLFTSLLTYRAFFNPLNTIPGPFLARFTRLSLTWKIAKRHNAHYLSQSLHRQYGPFVRTGPYDVSTIHPAAMQVIHGPKSTMTKAPVYDSDYPQNSLQTTRIRSNHDLRRRTWAGAFSDKALKGYELRVKKYVDQLVEKVHTFKGEPIDATRWFNSFTFDVMGDLAFGSPFDMIQSGEVHWVKLIINSGVELFGFLPPMWLFRLLADLPFLSAGYQRMIKWCAAQIQARVERQKENLPDIAHHLIEAMQQRTDKADAMNELANDTKLIVIAGSDTTSVALTHLFYYLARDQTLQQRLRSEIVECLRGEESITNLKLQGGALLNGCIFETLRVNPPIPTGLPRFTPPEGVTIGEIFLPGSTTLQIPSFVVGHDEAYYISPDSFIPERWSTAPDLIRVKDAFAPFGIGTYGCIGRNLALMEIRLMTARLLLDFDVSLAEGEDGRALLEEARDNFILDIKPLRLTFKARA